ncbi:hypothetical protein fugu_000634 [Takifugu bimaculatus]|uniref:Uncharacterized protein n=1 Tax=Takifugu bimaculatus TaxID=433685 RepID=A0A4Z2CHG5_9TELE|nr:hypothetical protein fugu_000634 [Takifugu bimaculatus]
MDLNVWKIESNRRTCRPCIDPVHIPGNVLFFCVSSHRSSLSGGKTLTTDLEDFMIFYWTYTPVFLDHTHITDKHTAPGFRVKVINAGGCVEILKKNKGHFYST